MNYIRGNKGKMLPTIIFGALSVRNAPNKNLSIIIIIIIIIIIYKEVFLQDCQLNIVTKNTRWQLLQLVEL